MQCMEAKALVIMNLHENGDYQLWIQAKGVLVTVAWSGVVSYIALKIAGAVVGGIRSDEDSEETGLDLTDHGESGYSS